MDTFKRASGVVLVVMAIVVAVHTVVEPLYYTSTEANPYSPVWDVLGWLMLVPLALGVLFGWLRKRDSERAGSGSAMTREIVAANTHFYGGSFLGIMFLWNWFNQISPGFTAIGSDTVALVWILLDAALPLLWVTMGMFLLCGDCDRSGA
ncbi:MAG: hypothetical protein OXI46_06725 [Gemmatimonadota bacterium]|nr:hypothetical protein [Gemmatimonadota bacterium]